MKKIILLAIIVLIFCPTVFAKQKLVIAVDEFPPFTDASSPTGGISIEIARAAFDTHDYEVSVVYVPWEKAEAEVKNGKYDILVNAWFTEERAKELLYSVPYVYSTVKFIKRKGDPFEYKGIDSLKGKRIGILQKSELGEEFMNNTTFTRVVDKDFISNIKKLLANEIDLTIEDEIIAKIALKKENRKLFKMVKFSKEPFSSNALHVASGRKNPKHKKIIDTFNRGYKIIKDNGILDTIINK